MLAVLRAAPRLPLRHVRYRSASTPDVLTYHEYFARRMAMAGVKPHHRIALGVSGGPDSTALCLLAAAWKTNGSVKQREQSSGFIEGLLGIVVNHELRPESGEEACLVQSRVAKMGIECEIVCCEWPDGRPKQGHVQEKAREMRYHLLKDVCLKQNIGVLLIAHHADDQAELFILRLSRNSGVLGLAGMPFVSELFPTHLCSFEEDSSHFGILLIRPMLEFSKDSIYRICQGGCQEWVEDPTNQSHLFARNRIRSSLSSSLSGFLKFEMQTLISLCRLTRSFVEDTCQEMIKQCVTVVDHGYAIIDLVKLRPSNVHDLCLSRFLVLILQFISQRHKSLRGSVSQLLIDYVRNVPCKTSITAAGCYLCPAPGSSGIKLLTCFSVNSLPSSNMKLSYFTSGEPQYPVSAEAEQIVIAAKSYDMKSIPKASDVVPFLNVKSSDHLLIEAEEAKVISHSTFSIIHSLKSEEHKKFCSDRNEEHGCKRRFSMNCASDSALVLQPGNSCHFMSRFVVRWSSKHAVEDTSSSPANGFCCRLENGFQHLCPNDHRKHIIRHMVDADWLYLSEISNNNDLSEYESSIWKEQEKMSEVHRSCFMRLSALRAIKELKLIPLPARRGLPVLVNSHDVPVCIPSIGFKCCPHLSVSAMFKPRIPLAGGYSSFM